ncbi:MAG: leucine-rich repeat protein, partial [Prevotellaceae bacterium]|nr:leucine-rich repeat protein [Prevotellaceae bacterium]
LLCGILLTAGAASAQTVASGTTGSCTWTLTGTSPNYTLAISGSGDMASYSSGSAPWYSYRSSIKTLTIGQGVTSIGSYAFRGYSGLTSVAIPNSVTSIGSNAFNGCSGLTSVTIPSSVTSIDYYAFYGCSGLTSVTIPSSVTSIGEGAFYGCSGLTSVTIPSSVTSIGEVAFSDCSGLTSFSVSESNTAYSSVDSVLFNKNQTTLIACPGGKTGSYDIPSSVTSIGIGAFYGCSGLTSVTIPSSVTSIGYYAFRGCSGLTSVTIPSSVTSIGDRAFYGCSGLTSVIIPSSVTSIGRDAFQSCSGLTSVTIPSSVTSIGESAFEDCSGLTSVTNLSLTPQGISSNVFGSLTLSNITLRVPADAVSAYQSAAVWKDFKITAINAATYTLTFDAQSGTVSPTSKTVTSGVAVGALPTPTRSGYTFGGWYTQPNGAGTQYIENTVFSTSDNLTLYAKWTANNAATYTLTFDAQEGTVSTTSKTVTDGVAVGALPMPTRSGYTFGGWYTKTNGAGTQYTENTVFSASSNLTLYAKWTANSNGEDPTGVAGALQVSATCYPNPFTGALHLTGAEGCTLTVLTAAGAPVHTQKLKSASETILLERLPSGMYFLRLEKDGKTKTLKAVKE